MTNKDVKYFIIQSTDISNNPPVFIGATTTSLCRRLATFKNIVKKNSGKYANYIDIANIDKYFIQKINDIDVSKIKDTDVIKAYIYNIMMDYRISHPNTTVSTLNGMITYSN